MALKLSYCQLIKIILTKIGGSPLQQVYTQLSQGLQQITKGGIIPSEFAQLKAFIDQVTTQLNAISGDINAMQQLTQKFFYNPVGTVTTELISSINSRLAQIEDLVPTHVPKIVYFQNDRHPEHAGTIHMLQDSTLDAYRFLVAQLWRIRSGVRLQYSRQCRFEF